MKRHFLALFRKLAITALMTSSQRKSATSWTIAFSSAMVVGIRIGKSPEVVVQWRKIRRVRGPGIFPLTCDYSILKLFVEKIDDGIRAMNSRTILLASPLPASGTPLHLRPHLLKHGEIRCTRHSWQMMFFIHPPKLQH